jgi:hypothetical protein
MARRPTHASLCFNLRTWIRRRRGHIPRPRRTRRCATMRLKAYHNRFRRCYRATNACSEPKEEDSSSVRPQGGSSRAAVRWRCASEELQLVLARCAVGPGQQVKVGSPVLRLSFAFCRCIASTASRKHTSTVFCRVILRASGLALAQPVRVFPTEPRPLAEPYRADANSLRTLSPLYRHCCRRKNTACVKGE